ncbi:MAG: Rho termination factor N-terminal domain-containing protein, partial [Eubacterium sp.]|nr:Rho termination factor N-terminal domain-containing protein [Eubacterium sp.]
MEYARMTIAELRALAKEKGIKKISALKKSELVELLERELPPETEKPRQEKPQKERSQQERPKPEKNQPESAPEDIPEAQEV